MNNMLIQSFLIFQILNIINGKLVEYQPSNEVTAGSNILPKLDFQFNSMNYYQQSATFPIALAAISLVVS